MSRTEKDAPYWVRKKRAAIDRDFARTIERDFKEKHVYTVEDFENIRLKDRYALGVYSSFSPQRAVLATSELVYTDSIPFVKVPRDNKVADFFSLFKDAGWKIENVESIRHDLATKINTFLELNPKHGYNVDDFSYVKSGNINTCVHINKDGVEPGYVLKMYTKYSYDEFDSQYLLERSARKNLLYDIGYNLIVELYYSEKLASGERDFEYEIVDENAFNDSKFRYSTELFSSKDDYCPCCSFDDKYVNKILQKYPNGSKTDFVSDLDMYAKVFNAGASVNELSDFIDGVTEEIDPYATKDVDAELDEESLNYEYFDSDEAEYSGNEISAQLHISNPELKNMVN